MLKRVLWPLLVIFLVFACLAPFITRVPDNDMAPSLLQGDFVLVLPRAPQTGDVVAVVDPLAPGRWTLRRVMALDGSIAFNGGLLSGTSHQEVIELGQEGNVLIVREGDHLVKHLPQALDWEMEERQIPEGRAFLVADNREEAMDSRWWGSMPLASLQGVVVFRFGPPQHRWRNWAALRN